MINFLDVRFWEREVLLTIKRNTSKFYAWDRFQVKSYTSTVIRETGTLWLCTAGPEDKELWEMRMEWWLEPDHRTLDPRGSILFSMQGGPMKVDGNHFLLFQNKYFFLQNIGILFGYTHTHTHTDPMCVCITHRSHIIYTYAYIYKFCMATQVWTAKVHILNMWIFFNKYVLMHYVLNMYYYTNM